MYSCEIFKISVGIYNFSEQLFWRTSVNVFFHTLSKKRHEHRCFPVNFVSYSRTKIAPGEGISLEFFINQNVSFTQKFLKFGIPFCENFCPSSFQRKLKMHYKTSQNIIRLDLMSYCNINGRHKTTGTIKKVAFGSTKVHSRYQ